MRAGLVSRRERQHPGAGEPCFQTDKEGKINTGRVLGLRRLEIRDPKWQSAMDAIADSMQTVGSKPYVRFYKRSEATGEYLPIILDVAGV